MTILNRSLLRKFLFCSLFLGSTLLKAQGCVAIRHFSSCSGSHPESSILGKGDVMLSSNYRYFKSFRHYRGTQEEPDRLANQTEVINHSHAWDWVATYGITNRWYATLVIPTVINTRSSLYEHGRSERHTSFSRGLSDLRWTLGYWINDPSKLPKGNIALGIGIKLPTGNFQATDIFYNVGPNNSPEVRPVDQSIQPGDGGFGITAELQFYRELSPIWFLYGGGFYLSNPRETNGVRTFRETLSPLLQNEAIMSVPDQLSLRLGLSHNISETITISLGARYDEVPIKDILGGSSGFRRPGNILALDPGISLVSGPLTLNLGVPFALRRERPQSITDRETERITGSPRNGDAAFADYLINTGITYRFSNNRIKLNPEKTGIFKQQNNN